MVKLALRVELGPPEKLVPQAPLEQREQLVLQVLQEQRVAVALQEKLVLRVNLVMSRFVRVLCGLLADKVTILWL